MCGHEAGISFNNEADAAAVAMFDTNWSSYDHIGKGIKHNKTC